MLQNMTSQPLSVGLDLSSLRDCAVSFWTVGLRTVFATSCDGSCRVLGAAVCVLGNSTRVCI